MGEDMFFSWAARILAVTIFVLSILKLGVALSIAMMPNVEDRAFWTSQYLGSGTTGRHIDKGTYGILVAITLGTLAEISFLLRTIRDK